MARSLPSLKTRIFALLAVGISRGQMAHATMKKRGGLRLRLQWMILLHCQRSLLRQFHL